MHHLTELSLRFPKTTALALLAITIGLGAGLPRVHTEFGYRVLLGDAHPSIQTLETTISRFGGGLPIQLAWTCGPRLPCETIFDQTSLGMAHAITQVLTPIDGIRSVVGPSNAPLLVPTPGGFSIRRLVEADKPVADAADLKTHALADPLWVRTFISPDGQIGVILVQTSDTRNATDVHILRAIQQALEPYKQRGFEFHLVGNSVSSVIAGAELTTSMAALIPFTILTIAFVLFLLSRSWRNTLFAMISVGIALLWTFGLLGWLGWPRDAILEILPALVLAIGTCDAIHLLSRWSIELSSGPAENPIPALRNAAKDVAGPCLVTSVTTAGALLSFCTSSLATFFRFGIIAAFGVIACLILTFSLLPLLLFRCCPSSRQTSSPAPTSWNGALSAVTAVSTRRPGTILIFTCAVSIFCAVGWLVYLRVDTYWYELIGERSATVRSIRFLERRVRPSASLEVEIQLPEEVRLESPETLARVKRLSEELQTIEGLGASTSILDLLGRLNRLLHGNDPQFERPAETEAANSELIDLISLEDSGWVDRWISFDRSRFRVSVEAPELPNAERTRVLREVRKLLQNQLPDDWSVSLTGALVINHDWTRDLQTTQLRSFPAALALVTVLVAVFLRSVVLAVAAMIPTVIPVVVTLGAMGWVGMSLDVGRAMIAAVLLGIAVDDSIHLLTQYKRHRGSGLEPTGAIRAAVMHVGPAVITTSLALSLGFLTLVASAWQTVSSFGVLVSLSILGALGADIFVLPALICVASKEMHSSVGRQSRVWE